VTRHIASPSFLIGTVAPPSDAVYVSRRVHILVLTDRDWTHPQGGGSGTNLYAQVSRWLAWGHRVSIIACGYPGADERVEMGALTMHRMGGRSTVFPRAIWNQWRGVVDDADVVLEVINGITFLTPLWLRTPHIALIHHIHREHYVREMGRKGAVAAFALEHAPLRLLYRHVRFLTVSEDSARNIRAHGIPADHIEINHNGMDVDAYGAGERARMPTLLYLGRLKRYKRLEVLLDVLERVSGVVLEVAGEGDHRADLEAQIAARGLGNRVRLHGFADEERKRRLLQQAWVHVTASSAEGWCLSVMEAAACGTPTVALGTGGLTESVVHGETGLLAQTPGELAEATRRLVEDGELRDRMGRAAYERARTFSWDRTAENTLDALERARDAAASRSSLPAGSAHTDAGRARAAEEPAAAAPATADATQAG
jgi:glycosyltransferase involved in cell wall biosynthesis